MGDVDAAAYVAVPRAVNDPNADVPEVLEAKDRRAGLPGALFPWRQGEEHATRSVPPEAMVVVAAERRDGGEAIGEVGAQVPGSRASHRGAEKADPVPVDRVARRGRLDGLEDVDLAVPLEHRAWPPAARAHPHGPLTDHLEVPLTEVEGLLQVLDRPRLDLDQ